MMPNTFEIVFLAAFLLPPPLAQWNYLSFFLSHLSSLSPAPLPPLRPHNPLYVGLLVVAGTFLLERWWRRFARACFGYG
jgi:hypothetical protein